MYSLEMFTTTPFYLQESFLFYLQDSLKFTKWIFECILLLRNLYLFITDINNYIIKMYLSEQLLVGLKWIVNPNILSLFTHRHDVPNLYGFLFSVSYTQY